MYGRYGYCTVLHGYTTPGYSTQSVITAVNSPSSQPSTVRHHRRQQSVITAVNSPSSQPSTVLNSSPAQSSTLLRHRPQLFFRVQASNLSSGCRPQLFIRVGAACNILQGGAACNILQGAGDRDILQGAGDREHSSDAGDREHYSGCRRPVTLFRMSVSLIIIQDGGKPQHIP